MLEDARAPASIGDAAVAVMCRSAEDARTGGAVGKSRLVGILSHDSAPPESTYYPAVASRTVCGIDQAIALLGAIYAPDRA
jgi:hypothetical protein